METNVIAFAGVIALLTISPGADMALVTRSALVLGPRAAFGCTLGISLGTMLWGVASAAGLAAVLTTSETAFNVVRLAGAAYLVWLGAHTLWRSRRGHPTDDPGESGPAAGPPTSGSVRTPVRRSVWLGRNMRAAFRQGLVSNLLNPKVGLFYTVILPQFVAPADPLFAVSLLLAGIHVAFGLAWLSTYAWAVTRAGDVLRRPRVRHAFDAVVALVLIGLGLRVVLERM